MSQDSMNMSSKPSWASNNFWHYKSYFIIQSKTKTQKHMFLDQKYCSNCWNHSVIVILIFATCQRNQHSKPHTSTDFVTTQGRHAQILLFPTFTFIKSYYNRHFQVKLTTVVIILPLKEYNQHRNNFVFHLESKISKFCADAMMVAEWNCEVCFWNILFSFLLYNIFFLVSYYLHCIF